MAEKEHELHTVAGVQHYAAQFAKLAVSLQDDDALAQSLIEAVHSGSSAEVERALAASGVDARVSLTTVDESGGGGEPGIASAARTGTTTVTVTVKIGIGPFNVSFSYTKEKKTN